MAEQLIAIGDRVMAGAYPATLLALVSRDTAKVLTEHGEQQIPLRLVKPVKVENE